VFVEKYWREHQADFKTFLIQFDEYYKTHSPENKELAEMFRGPIEVIPPRPGETVTTLADNKKAKELLGWEPTVDLPSGVEELKKLHGLA